MNISIQVDLSNLLSKRKSFAENVNDILFSEKSIFEINSMDEVFLQLKAAGLDSIELIIPATTTERDIMQAKKLFAKYGITVASLHQSLSSLSNLAFKEIINLCRFAKLFSVKVITLHAGAIGDKFFESSFIDSLKKLQKDNNVIFGIENMPRSPFSFGKAYTYEGKLFASLMQDKNLSITYDTTHLAQVGNDILEFYSMNKKSIINIHLSDYRKHWVNRQLLLYKDTHLPLLKGTLPIKELLQQLKKDHYRGLITLEINDKLTEICESVRIVKTK